MAVCMAVKKYDRSCAEIIFLVKLYQRTVVDDLGRVVRESVQPLVKPR